MNLNVVECALRTPGHVSSACAYRLPDPLIVLGPDLEPDRIHRRQKHQREHGAGQGAADQRVRVTSADMLIELEQSLHDAGIELRFAEMKDPVKDKLRRLEVLEQIGNEIFHPTIGAAVDSYALEHGVDWTP